MSEVFVDTSFLVAVVDATSDVHAVAQSSFRDIVDDAREARLQLVSHALAVGAASDRLSGAIGGQAGLLLSDLVAPIEVEPVHRDALRLARKTLEREPSLDLLQALTLALVARRDIRTVATFDPLYARYGLLTVPAVPAVPPGATTADDGDAGSF